MGQKNEKPIKPVNEKNFMLFSGLCLCIFAFILIMDVGYVARTLTFIPNFLFGFGTYLFLLLLIIKGISLVFANRRIKFKHMAWIISGIVVMMVGISSLISLTSYKTIYYIDNFSSIYASHFANYYSEIKLPFLFQSGNQSIGGGYIGYMPFGAGPKPTGGNPGGVFDCLARSSAWFWPIGLPICICIRYIVSGS